MNQLPINPLSPEEQQRIMEQMYWLCGKQIQSYHKHWHMGSNSSVRVELAQELMESIEYTINQVGGVHAHRNMEDAFLLGQEMLKMKRSKAKAMLELVNGTVPQWQTECRWDALGYLRHYLESYDHLHLAHRGPEDLFYPILISTPEGIQGIDICLFYLNILWIENRIMAGVPDHVLEQFWERLPVGTLNQCEQLLINGIGKALMGKGLDPLVFEPEEYMEIIIAMMRATDERLRDAATLLCQLLDLKDENARHYVGAAVPLLTMWIGDHVHNSNLHNLFR